MKALVPILASICAIVLWFNLFNVTTNNNTSVVEQLTLTDMINFYETSESDAMIMYRQFIQLNGKVRHSLSNLEIKPTDSSIFNTIIFVFNGAIKIFTMPITTICLATELVSYIVVPIFYFLQPFFAVSQTQSW